MISQGGDSLDVMEFVGIDLGWKASPPAEKATAICVMDSKGMVNKIELVTENDEILSFLERDSAWAGIDAPLIVNNQEGLRGCERSLFDRGIRVLPANRTFMGRKFGSCRGVDLANRLFEMGYSFPGEREDKVIYEVYPYGALQILTGGEMPRYKKGQADERRKGAMRLLEIVRDWLPVSIPSWLDEEIDSATPGELKSVMDKVDSVICVLCVYCHWLYSGKRTEILGDQEYGFVLLPRR